MARVDRGARSLRWSRRVDALVTTSAAFGVRADLFEGEFLAAEPAQVVERESHRHAKVEEDSQDFVGQRSRVEDFDRFQTEASKI